MSDGSRRGRRLGAHVRADSSWIAIAPLLAATFAMLFQEIDPRWSAGAVIADAIVASLLVVASVAARELARLAVARAARVPIVGSTVSLVGTLWRTAPHAPTRPAREIAVACAGPATHFALAAAMLAASTFVGGVRAPAGAVEVLRHAAAILAVVGIANAGLGFFDTAPALPLDGGRILRALLWRHLGDRARAHAISLRFGRGVAIAAIVLGVLVALGFGELRLRGLVVGLWLAMLGWSVLATSASEVAHARGEGRLRGVRASQLMRPASSVAPTTSLSRVVTDELVRHDAAMVAVCEGRVCLGVLRLEQVRRIPATAWDTTDAASAMTPLGSVPDRIAATDDAADALRAMERTGWHALPVLSADGGVIGVLDRRDLVRWIAAVDEDDEVVAAPA